MRVLKYVVLDKLMRFQAIGQAMGLPLFRKEIRGKPLNLEKTYEVLSRFYYLVSV